MVLARSQGLRLQQVDHRVDLSLGEGLLELLLPLCHPLWLPFVVLLTPQSQILILLTLLRLHLLDRIAYYFGFHFNY